METNLEKFVPYTHAVLLKVLGFNEPTFARYRRKTFQFQTLGKPYDYNSSPIVDGDISAPMWGDVLDWFLKTFNIYIKPLNIWENYSNVELNFIETPPTGWIMDLFLYDENFSEETATIYPTYELARTACVEYSIKLASGILYRRLNDSIRIELDKTPLDNKRKELVNNTLNKVIELKPLVSDDYNVEDFINNVKKVLK